MNSQLASSQVSPEGHLLIGGVDSVSLAKKYGTPLIVYDVGQIRQQIRKFKQVFEEEKTSYAVSYASKAFATIAMYQVVQKKVPILMLFRRANFTPL